MTTILVTGRDGQIGWELQRSLLPLGRIVAPARADFDLADPAQMRGAVREIRPDIIINAAAHTAVDQAESEPGAAFALNAVAPGVLAEEAARCGALLVHYSTDYVFDGAKATPYDEDDAPAPLNVYGRSKLEGERAVRAAGGDHLILRTSWVYAARGRNFLRTVLRLAGEREELKVVADQIGAPTWARLIAEATAAILGCARGERQRGQFVGGVFHLTAAGETSWYGFAAALTDALRAGSAAGDLRLRRLAPVTTAEYPLPAPRPLNSRLCTDRVRQRFGLTLPDWQHCMRLCLEEIHGTD